MGKRQSFVKTTVRARLFGGSALAIILASGPGLAETRICDQTALPIPAECRRANAGIAVGVPAGENTESVKSRPGAGFADTGFSISIDDQTIAGAPAPRNSDRKSDIAAAAANVDLRYDGLDTRRMLNVTTSDLRAAYRAGEQVRFRTSANYPAFIRRGEIRILDLERRGKPVVAVIPAQANGTAEWIMPEDGPERYAYVLRVYDARGRYDETVPLEIRRTDKPFETHQQVGTVPVAPGESEDRTARRGIPVRGGVITASGSGAAPGGTVRLMGEPVPVDGAGRFVVSRILPAGDHVVTIETGGRRIVRDVHIPASEWFRLGIVDITAGLRDSEAGNLDESYVDGRLAFYVKGKTRNGFTITGSLDTGEGPIEDIFSRLNDKDPRRVLDRLRQDGTELYPTYGDDSTWFDDTPTAGRVYLRAESETLRFTWGDFKAGVTGSGLLQNTRDLYGAELRYQSPGVTSAGEPRIAVMAYAATPDTLAQRDILRGTGGSVYFLTHQDVTAGSVTLTVQVIDPDTGRVVSTRTLAEGTDYTIDHIQGVVMLTHPLESGAEDGGLISDGGPEYDVNLVAQYEYTPNSTEVNDTAWGGRAEVWATDRLRFGATVMRESTAAGDQNMHGADLRFQISEKSYAELEYARTEGPGFSHSATSDGGLTIVSSAGVASSGASALRFDSRFDLQETGLGREGFIGVYYERKEAGFSTLTESITADQTLAGVEFEVSLSPRLTFGGDIEHFTKDSGDERDEAELRLSYQLNDRWTVEGALQLTDRTTVGKPAETGRRLDAAIKAIYAASEDLELYGFVQGTLDRSGGLERNDRLGFGFDAQLSEKLSLAGEVSGGTSGEGASLRLSYVPTADNEVYLGYTLDPTREGAGGSLRDRGRVVLGGRYRVSDAVTTYSETVYDLPTNQRSLSNIFGVNYTPNSAWTLSGTVEKGTVRDDVSGDFDRLALSFGAAYSPSERKSWRARLEYRTEDGAGTARDRDTWAFTGGFTNKVNDNWRFLANVDALISESAEGDFRDGEYVRASLGYAYRPTDNERLNILLRYTYLRDLPGEDQVGADGTTNQPLQVSNIFSVNAAYDLSPRLTLGGKLGWRQSRVAPRGTTAFTDNTATLAALRLDWHVTHKWDITGEGRVLFTDETDTTETGAMLAVYRHLNANVKLGLGVEWGNVSDDLADINYTNRGVFLNIVGKF